MTKVGIMADTHLSTLQYHSWKRHAHFGEKWLWALNLFIQNGVDFVIHAGDLFGSRKPDFIALSQATTGLRFLKNMGIPFFIVEGNHERPIASEGVGVLDFLQDEGLLYKLEYGVPRVRPGGTLWGVPYSGLAINEQISNLCAKNHESFREGAILVAHTGLSFYPKDMFCDPNGLSQDVFEEVEKKFNLFVTGHIHRNYQFRNNLNPGSTEVCSIKELDYRHNGIMIVELPYGTSPVRIYPSEAYKRFAVFEIDTDKVTQKEAGATLGADVFKERVIVIRLKGSGAAVLDKRELIALAEKNGNIVHFVNNIEISDEAVTLPDYRLDTGWLERELLQKMVGDKKAALYYEMMESALADEAPEEIVERLKRYEDR